MSTANFSKLPNNYGNPHVDTEVQWLINIRNTNSPHIVVWNKTVSLMVCVYRRSIVYNNGRSRRRFVYNNKCNRIDTDKTRLITQTNNIY